MLHKAIVCPVYQNDSIHVQEEENGGKSLKAILWNNEINPG